MGDCFRLNDGARGSSLPVPLRCRATTRNPCAGGLHSYKPRTQESTGGMRRRQKFAEALRFFVPAATHALRTCHATDVQALRAATACVAPSRFAKWHSRARGSNGSLRNDQKHPHALIAIERRCENLSICFVVTIRRRTSLNSYAWHASDGARPPSSARPPNRPRLIRRAKMLRLRQESDQ